MWEKTHKVSQTSPNFIIEFSKNNNKQGKKKELSIGIKDIIQHALYLDQSQLFQLHLLLLKIV